MGSFCMTPWAHLNLDTEGSAVVKASATPQQDSFELPDLPMPLPIDVYERSHILFAHGYRQKAVLDLCTDDNVRIKVPDDAEPPAALPPREVLRARVVMQVCGFVMLHNVIPAELLKQLQHENSVFFDKFYAENIVGRPELRDAHSYETNTFAIRSQGRIEYSIPLHKPFTDDHVLMSPFVSPVLSEAMQTSELVIDTFSCVSSLPSTPIQHWSV